MKRTNVWRLFSRLLVLSGAMVVIFCLQVYTKTRVFASDRTAKDLARAEDGARFSIDALANVREFISKKVGDTNSIDTSQSSRNTNRTAKTRVFTSDRTAKDLARAEDGARFSIDALANVREFISKKVGDTNSIDTSQSSRNTNRTANEKSDSKTSTSSQVNGGEKLASMQQQQQQEQQQQPLGAANSSESAFVSINGLIQVMEYGIQEINCSQLYLGDVNETIKAKAIQKTKPHKKIQPEVYINATKNCEAFRFARGYVNNVTEEELDFPLAYSILIHKSVEQFERLLRAIYRTNNYYCIHVDKKVNQDFFEAVKSIVDCFPNVFIASKLEVVVYAGYTRLQADINCMEELYGNFSDWKYVLNMAGSELPLKSNLEMVQLLKLYNGSNLVGKNMKALNPGRWNNRYETVVNGSKGFIIKRNSSNIHPPSNLTMTKGSAYVILTRDMVGYVLNDPVPQGFLEFCKSTYSPDEHFWATLNNLEHNSHLKTPGGIRCKGPSYMERAVMWYSPKCQGKLVRSVCTFGAGDLPWIYERPEFIVNKFDLDIDYVAYYCTEQLIQQRQHNLEPWDLGKHKAYQETHSDEKCLTQKNV